MNVVWTYSENYMHIGTIFTVLNNSFIVIGLYIGLMKFSLLKILSPAYIVV